MGNDGNYPRQLAPSVGNRHTGSSTLSAPSSTISASSTAPSIRFGKIGYVMHSPTNSSSFDSFGSGSRSDLMFGDMCFRVDKFGSLRLPDRVYGPAPSPTPTPSAPAIFPSTWVPPPRGEEDSSSLSYPFDDQSEGYSLESALATLASMVPRITTYPLASCARSSMPPTALAQEPVGEETKWAAPRIPSTLPRQIGSWPEKPSKEGESSPQMPRESKSPVSGE